MHLGVLVLVSGFLALGWWQINRAAQGNTLSWGYAVQWPVFAAFLVWFWIVEMRRAVQPPAAVETAEGAGGVTAQEDAPVRLATEAAVTRRRRNEAAYDDSGDPTLAEYNHYLAWLNANPHARPADYPGMTEPAA